MNISIREIYWALVLMSIVSSLLYITTTISVKANSIDIDNATTIVNDVPEHIIKDLKKLSFTSTSTNDLKAVDEHTSHDEKFTSEQKQELAEIHSSFDETVSSSNGGKSLASSADISEEVIQPVPQAQVSNKLSETGQAVVFTLVDSAAVELQQRAASAPQQTESLGLSDNLTATLPPVSSGDHGSSLTSIKDEGKEAENLSTSEVNNETSAKIDEQYVVRAEPKVVEQKKDFATERREDSMEMVGDAEKTEIVPEEVVPVANGSFGDEGMQDGEHTDHSAPEDMPVFSEWTQKQLAEAEEKKKVNNETAVPAGGSSQTSSSQKMLKLRSKNYASPDCGAKIVATNPEALSAGSVLSPSRDEYVLNTCTSRIWFVVELCEGIQAKKIDLANFELFSSSPRDFTVYVSDRFPSRDWRSVGQFTAEDERTIQSFNLNPHQFGKFIKVELHSHYGSEHFCPVSLFRAYGTSEFEVLDTVDEVHETVTDIDDDDDDDDLDGALNVDTGNPPQNLFDSARDAVLSIVKKAAEALGKGGKASNDTSMLNITSEDTALETNQPKLCKSPRHIVVCDNCSNALYDDVYELLSCQEDHLQMLMLSSFVSDVIRDSELCARYGLFFTNQRLGAPYPLRPTSMLERLRTDPGGYVSALFPPKYIAALCNMLAIFEKKVALNISDEPNTTTHLSDGSEQVKIPDYLEQGFDNVLQPVATCSIDNSVSSRTCASSEASVDYNIGLSTSAPPLDSSSTESSVASQINPTKTMVNEDDRQDTFPSSLLSSNIVTSVETVVAETLTQDIPASVPLATTVVKTSDKIGPGEAPVPHPEGIPETPDIVEAKESELPQAESSENASETASVEDQEQLALDTLLLFDLKDLDQAGDSSSAPTVTTTTVAPPISAPAQKESVFLRLANRIKALERNMSLSGQYLEELSRRYKKQMEEMQRAFNRTLSAVGEESRRGEEREQRRLEEMLSLQRQLASLSSAVAGLLSERDSWLYRANVIIQHVILISAEVLIFVLVLYFCRRIPTPPVALEEKPHRKQSVGVKNRKSSKVTLKRRKSVEGVSGHESPRVRNRRPSEEALNIAGTYRELLIAENAISELDAGVWTVSKAESKRRRRKKKDLPVLHKSSSVSLVHKPNYKRSTGLTNSLSGVGQSINVPSRRVSSSEVGKWWDSVSSVQVKEEPITRTRCQRQESAPEPFVSILEPPQIEEIMVTQGSVHSSPSSTSGYIVERTSSVELQHKLDENLSPKESVNGVDVRTKEVISSNSVPALNQNNGLTRSVTGASSKPRPLSSPLFMKTAVSSRSNRRIGNSSEPSPQARLKSDNWEWYSSRHNTSAEKSSQNTQFPSTLTGQNHNGQLETEDENRTSIASIDSETSDLTRKESNKKGGTGSLKKMVKRFF